MKIVEESNSFMNQFIANMEEGFKRLNEFHQELANTSLKFFNKQDEIITILQENFSQLEDGWKKSVEAWLESMKFQLDDRNFQELDVHFENWNKQIDLIKEQIDQLSEQQNPLPVHLFDELHQKMLEISQILLEEQEKRQQNTLEIVKQHFQQLQDFQTNYIKRLEEISRKQ